MKILNKFIWSKTEPKNKNDVWFDGSVFRLFKEEEWQAFTINLQDANEVVKLKDFLTKYLAEEIIPTVEDAKEAVKTIQIYVDLAVDSVRQATEAVNKAEDLTSRAETVVPQAENVVRDITIFKDTIQGIWDNLYIEINNAISNANEAADRANNSIVFYPISDSDVSIIMGNLPRTDSFVEEYTGHTYVYNNTYGLWYLSSDLSICTNVPSIQSYNVEDEGRVFVQNISYVYNSETNRYEGQGLYGKIPVRLLYDGFDEFGGQKEALFTNDGGHNIVLKTRQQFTDAEKAQIKENLGISGSGGGADVDSELSTTSTNPVQNKTITSKLTELSEEIGKKQDTITDLETIRSGAAKGATALQSVPSTYATKTDVSNAIAEAITNELNTAV